MIISALVEILPKKNNLFAFVISIFLAIIFAVIIGISKDTVEISLSIVEVLLNIIIAIFGCIFAVYSILLAFLNDSYIEKLSKINYGNGVSYLKTSTTYYESILFLYFIALGITIVLLLFLNCIEDSYTLTSNSIVNNCLAIFFLFLYFAFIFRILYELKSTIYNTIVLFRASIAYKILAFARKEKDDQIDDNYK